MTLGARIRYLTNRGLVGLLTITGAAFAVSAWMVRSTRRQVFRALEAVPSRPIAIVLGARVYPDQTPSAVVEDRLQAALELHRVGKVSAILVSGDCRAKEGDETAGMRRWLLEKGVPEGALQVDPKGVRTWATLERARGQYDIGAAVICTQAFHLPRALYLARRAGIDAVGFVADRRVYRGRRKDAVREFFAQQVAFLERVLAPRGGASL